MKIIRIVISIISLSFIASNSFASNADTARSWINDAYTGKDEMIASVKENMAEDGLNYPGRFVGFGFNWDPDLDEGRMVVQRVIADSPAEGILQPGDEFISVEGVEVNQKNIDEEKLPFSGLPGKKVNAVIIRNGNEKNIAVTRGIVNSFSTKSQVLENLSGADSENWTTIEHRINEVATNDEDNTVYVWHWHKSLNTTFDLEFEQNVVTRLAFNDEGKVIAIGDLSEERLVLSQLGFSLTR
mgnify:FL=1|tara:strand:+ start:33 stop:758 length:726 start_codon:yes stop_codon:yes gene_type:complete